jgi:hypothetical protein
MIFKIITIVLLVVIILGIDILAKELQEIKRFLYKKDNIPEPKYKNSITYCHICGKQLDGYGEQDESYICLDCFNELYPDVKVYHRVIGNNE